MMAMVLAGMPSDAGAGGMAGAPGGGSGYGGGGGGGGGGGEGGSGGGAMTNATVTVGEVTDSTVTPRSELAVAGSETKVAICAVTADWTAESVVEMVASTCTDDALTTRSIRLSSTSSEVARRRLKPVWSKDSTVPATTNDCSIVRNRIWPGDAGGGGSDGVNEPEPGSTGGGDSGGGDGGGGDGGGDGGGGDGGGEGGGGDGGGEGGSMNPESPDPEPY